MRTIFTFLIALCPLSALAQTEIRFTNQELNAAFTLIRPELNQLELNGQSGTFTPSPALQFFGLEEQRFAIDFSGVASLANIDFNHLKSLTPEVNFQNGSLEVSLPVQDQNQAIQTRLGSISVKGVRVTVVLGFKPKTQSPILEVKTARLEGILLGSGVLKPTLVLNQVKSILLKSVSRLVEKIINREATAEALQKGLLTWAKFYSGTEFHSVTPQSAQFFNDTNSRGLVFQVEP